jgi:hypothetical protein
VIVQKKSLPAHVFRVEVSHFKMGLSVVDWNGLAQDRYRWRALVNVVTNLQVQ